MDQPAAQFGKLSFRTRPRRNVRHHPYQSQHLASLIKLRTGVALYAAYSTVRTQHAISDLKMGPLRTKLGNRVLIVSLPRSSGWTLANISSPVMRTPGSMSRIS